MNRPEPRIPMLDLSAELEELWPDLQATFERVVRAGQFIQGPDVAQFEAELADYLGVPASQVVGVASGTDALVVALEGLGVGEGDEVITSAFSFVASASAISLVRARPVFADVDPLTLNLDLGSVERAIGPATRAIIPVHLYGRPAAMEALQKLARDHELLVVEDVAQALSGRAGEHKLGTLGDAAAFSFFPSKNLGAYGDAGAVRLSSPEAAERARALRAHGAKRKYFNEILGHNSRLDTLQAAILRVKLPRLEAATAGRARAAVHYDVALEGVAGLIPPPRAHDGVHSYHQYTVRILDGRRDAVRAALDAGGISTMIYYPVALPDLPLFAGCRGEGGHARVAAREVLSLPIWPGMPPAVQDRVVEALKAALR
jgi:dTDP-4-amino-4,6-dideoxygalactose transaminase